MIYITGALGFIGSNLIRELNKQGIYNIVAVDEFNEIFPTWKYLYRERFVDLLTPKKFYESFDNLIDSSDVVVHLGGDSNTKNNNAKELWNRNSEYTCKLIKKSCSIGNKIIYASSASIYGNSININQETNVEPSSFQELRKTMPINEYAFSKYMIDKFILENRIENAIGLRYFNVWGSQEKHKRGMESFISKNIENAKNKKKIVVYYFKSKNIKRDFIYVNKACDVTKYFIENDCEWGIYNVGSGISHSFDFMAEKMYECFDVNPKFKIKRKLISSYLDTSRYQWQTKADLEKLKKVGYKVDCLKSDTYKSDIMELYTINRRTLHGI